MGECPARGGTAGGRGAAGGVHGEEAMSLTRPEGTALCSGQGEGVDPVPEDGAPGAGLCGSSRAGADKGTRTPLWAGGAPREGKER